jgi:serine/threonine-protein kinase
LRWWLLPLMLGPLAVLIGVLWLIGPDRSPGGSPAADAGPLPAIDRAGASEKESKKQGFMLVDGANGSRAGLIPDGGGKVAGTSDADGTPDGGPREGPEPDGGGKVAGTSDADGTPGGGPREGPEPDGGGKVAGTSTGRAAKADRRQRVAYGRLSLNVIPWARVRFGKRLLGDTPLRRVRLPAGRHVLLLVNGELGVRRRIRVEIRPGQLTRRLVDLRAAAPD